MAKNLIPEIAKMLGVEINESFKLAGYDNATFRFTENRFWQEDGNSCEERSDILAMLLAGNEIIVKLPWKPKEGETYWTFILYDSDIRLGIKPCKWTDDIFDFAFFKAGWIYRSYEEAEAALPTVAKEMGVEYKI